MGLIQVDALIKRRNYVVLIKSAILDTGSDYTIIPMKYMAELGIRFRRNHWVDVELYNRGTVPIYGPYKSSVAVGKYTARNINIYFDELGFEPVVGHNFLQASGYRINYTKMVHGVKKSIKRIRYLRAIYPQNARLRSYPIRKPKRIDGRWWMVDIWRANNKIMYNKLYIIRSDKVIDYKNRGLIV